MTAIQLEPSAWARPQLRDSVVRRRNDGRPAVLLHLDAAPAPRLILQLEARLQALAGLKRLDLDRTAAQLRLAWDPGQLDLPRILQTLATAGCAARPLPRHRLADTRRSDAHVALKRLLVAGLFAMQAMMFAFVLYLQHFDAIDAATVTLFRWLSMLAAVPVLLWAALPFYQRAVADLRRRRVGTETVVTVAVLLISSGSLMALMRGHGEVYFESISMLVFVLLLGRWLELRGRQMSAALADAAADALPLAAQRRDVDGTLAWVAVAELEPGDRVEVAEGGRVPVDGRVTGPAVLLDESVLTGEAHPVRKGPDEPVVAGSLVCRGPLELEVVRPVDESTAARLDTLASTAGKLRRDTAGDRLAANFALRVLALAALTALFWLWFKPGQTLDAVVAVLVVACPCAFALAAPLVASRASAVLRRLGVWLVRPAALQPLVAVDQVLLDKTGTLTSPGLDKDRIRTRQDTSPDMALALAAALASRSSHPLARLLAETCGDRDLLEAVTVEVQPGGGISGTVAGRSLRLGHAGFVSVPVPEACADEALLLADESGLVAVFPVDEQLRPGVAKLVSGWQTAGIKVGIVSGDAPARVATVARQLGIDEWQARATPEDKLERVRACREAGATVLAVGDGSNDAPFLAATDVSAAVVGATDLARARADLILTGGVTDLAATWQVAQRSHDILRQNRHGALIYNLCAVPFAAAGLVPPWLAVIGMSASSLAVVLNALRIGAGGTEPPPRAALAKPHTA